MQRHHWLSVTFGVVACIGIWLFLGIEVIHREHDTDVQFFAKQQPGLRVTYTNPVLCGECDVKPLDKLDQTQRAEFLTFCEVRFGLREIRQCYAIYAEAQRMVLEHWPAARPATPD